MRAEVQFKNDLARRQCRRQCDRWAEIETHPRNCELQIALGRFLGGHLFGDDFVGKVERHIVRTIGGNAGGSEVQRILGELVLLVFALDGDCDNQHVGALRPQDWRRNGAVSCGVVVGGRTKKSVVR